MSLKLRLPTASCHTRPHVTVHRKYFLDFVYIDVCQYRIKDTNKCVSENGSYLSHIKFEIDC